MIYPKIKATIALDEILDDGVDNLELQVFNGPDGNVYLHIGDKHYCVDADEILEAVVRCKGFAE